MAKHMIHDRKTNLAGRFYKAVKAAGVDAVEDRVAPLNVGVVQDRHRAEPHGPAVEHLAKATHTREYINTGYNYNEQTEIPNSGVVWR